MLHDTLFVCGVFVMDFIFDSMGEFGVASHYLLVLNLLLFILFPWRHGISSWMSIFFFPPFCVLGRHFCVLGSGA